MSDVAPVTLLFQGKAFQVVIDDFSPRQGAIGSTVTITGLGFTGATAVSFNDVPAQSFTVVSDTTLTAVVALGTTTGKIKVTAPLGIGISAVDFTIVNDASLLVIQDEGNLVGARPTLNFIGPVVTATDNPGSNRVDVTVTPPTIQDEGVVIAARPTLNFVGSAVTVTDNPGNNRIDVNITAGSGSGSISGIFDFITGQIITPIINYPYILDFHVKRSYLIKNISIGMGGGNVNFTIRISRNQGTTIINIPGLTDCFAWTTPSTYTASNNNLALVNDTIQLLVLSANTASNLAYTLEIEYA